MKQLPTAEEILNRDYISTKENAIQASIHQLGQYSCLFNIDSQKTVESLEFECLKKLIEIVKNKQLKK